MNLYYIKMKQGESNRQMGKAYKQEIHRREVSTNKYNIKPHWCSESKLETRVHFILIRLLDIREMENTKHCKDGEEGESSYPG